VSVIESSGSLDGRDLSLLGILLLLSERGDARLQGLGADGAASDEQVAAVGEESITSQSSDRLVVDLRLEEIEFWTL
jgi:hypothetical protein